MLSYGTREVLSQTYASTGTASDVSSDTHRYPNVRTSFCSTMPRSNCRVSRRTMAYSRFAQCEMKRCCMQE
jgi:hypothetical protein